MKQARVKWRPNSDLFTKQVPLTLRDDPGEVDNLISPANEAGEIQETDFITMTS